MNTEQQQKFFQEAAAAAAEAASAASRPPVTAANLAAAASNPYLAALAASTGNPTSAYLQPPALGSFPPVSAPAGSTDNSWLMSSLLQASIRQQWMSQLASIQAAGAAPFMNPLAASMASLGAGAFPSSLPPPRLPLLLPTNTSTTSSKTGKENSSKILASNSEPPAPTAAAPPPPPSVPTTSSTSSGLDTASMYREFLKSIVQQQSSANNGGSTNSEAASAAAAAAEAMASLIGGAAVASNTVKEDSNGNSKSVAGKLFESSPKAIGKSEISARARPPPANNGRSEYNGKDKVFTCKTCNRSFGYKHVLQNHERTHTGEKPFECKVCHKRFTRDHHLKTHMRLHTGEKPYSCTHCDRQFVQVANLRRHLRVHTGERPYKCDVCLSCFSDSNQLKAHILIHKGEKPFTCEKCNGKFRRRHHLMHHVCPMAPAGSSSQQAIDPMLHGDMDDEDDDERFILAAKRARSASLKEGMFEESPPSLLARLSQNATPSNLELSIIAARAAMERNRLYKDLQQGGSPPAPGKLPLPEGMPPLPQAPVTTMASAVAAAVAAAAAASAPRSRKSQAPKRLNPSSNSPPMDMKPCLDDEPEHTPRGMLEENRSTTPLPQSEPEDLSNKNMKLEAEDVNLDLMAITTSEVPVVATGPTPTLSQMPIANK